ncbi:PAS domain-containing protein [Neolewinella antarctica]|uniref:PAS domain S-box-containing protein n=1 Tax=Neolewinella antarctica TaxID=442734 RepID=A0ABX0X982_9BACT|nr:PAS domain-containing protein [Neolewinella antarctica]NJC25519.1 PAS domain S-box-containing protein [Neolewinella antarctica]
MSHVAVILTDAERHIIWVNKDFEHITGYSMHDVLGENPGTVLQGPATEPDIAARIRQGLKQDVPIKETITNHRKNGEPYSCTLVIHPIFDQAGSLINYIAFEIENELGVATQEVSLLNLDHRYRTSSLRGLNEVRLFENIKRTIETEQLYLDANLTLRKLSVRLDTNTKYLSQVINHQGNANFLTFINAYRIEAVKRQITNGEFYQHTFYGIAQRCGFKNKSTFYKVFRDSTGLTPKAFAESAHAKA